MVLPTPFEQPVRNLLKAVEVILYLRGFCIIRPLERTAFADDVLALSTTRIKVNDDRRRGRI